MRRVLRLASDSPAGPSLYEMRQSDNNSQPAVVHDDLEVEISRQWLQSFKDQRQHLFDTLCELIDDEDQCMDVIIKAQQNPDGLREICERDINDSSWTVKNTDQLPMLVGKYTWACQSQIALLDLEIKQLEQQLDIAVKEYQAEHKSRRAFLSLPLKVQEAVQSLFQIIGRGYQHLGAVRVLQSRENFLRDRGRGNAVANRKATKTEMQQLVTVLVKLLYQSNPHPNARANKSELITWFTQKILEIWSGWSFFPLNKEELAGHVGEVVKKIHVPSEEKQMLFKRRIRTTMARPQRNDIIRPIVPSEMIPSEVFARECEAWQAGVADALVQVLESKFDVLNDAHKATIRKASPEQVGIWLRSVHGADSIDKLLIPIYKQGGK